METKTILWIVIGIMFLAVLYLTFKTSSINAVRTGNAITGNAIDTTGWTDNEKMNYEMHGTLPARLGNANQQSGGGMVGGC